MAFIEAPRFPESVSNSTGWVGGPGYKTDVIEVDNGREQRNAVWDYPLHQYDCSIPARLLTEFVPLQNFIHDVGGRHNGFRVKDPTDYQVTAADPRSEGIFEQIDTTHFQMVKKYYNGVRFRLRAIQKPTSNIVITGGTLSVLDLSTGIATMTSGTPTSWVGHFDVPCRFELDRQTYRLIQSARGHLIEWDSIPIIEIRI